MNNKTRNGLIVVGVVAILGFITYKFAFPKSTIGLSSREIVRRHLIANYGVDGNNFSQTAEQGYIDAWAKAIKEGMPTFIYNDKTYNTIGGKAKV
jgi:hypothetical protein